MPGSPELQVGNLLAVGFRSNRGTSQPPWLSVRCLCFAGRGVGRGGLATVVSPPQRQPGNPRCEVGGHRVTVSYVGLVIPTLSYIEDTLPSKLTSRVPGLETFLGLDHFSDFQFGYLFWPTRSEVSCGFSCSIPPLDPFSIILSQESHPNHRGERAITKSCSSGLPYSEMEDLVSFTEGFWELPC